MDEKELSAQGYDGLKKHYIAILNGGEVSSLGAGTIYCYCCQVVVAKELLMNHCNSAGHYMGWTRKWAEKEGVTSEDEVALQKHHIAIFNGKAFGYYCSCCESVLALSTRHELMSHMDREEHQVKWMKKSCPLRGMTG